MHVSNIVENNLELNSSTNYPLESIISLQEKSVESNGIIYLTNLKELISVSRIQKRFREFLNKKHRVKTFKRPVNIFYKKL